MKAVVLGGTHGMGRAVARRLAERGDDVFLLGRDEEELTRSVGDLRQRHPAGKNPGHAHCDLEKPEGFVAALDAADRALGDFDTVVVTAGMFATQEVLEGDTELSHRLMMANYCNTVVFCEHVRKRLLARGGGKLAVFSSVAGDRGRKTTGIYGSSKAGLSLYLEALDHKWSSAGLDVTCVKPGFVKTGMTAGLKPPPFAGEPEHVAGDVLAALDGKKPLIYTPRIWGLVMFVIRMLPRFVMRKIGF
ncbi:MAG: hypothetical protein JWP97_6566 [Labilithrix sp.]|nr:hypothetical protein [Labilithrix sp.]